MEANKLRTPRLYNLDLISRSDCDAVADWLPSLQPVDAKPDKLVGFNYALTSHADQRENGLHFFVDDYQFERVWRDPDRYLPVVQNFGTVLTPDFSLYTDMPVPMQIWNLYRSRAIGAWWQRMGITVVPTLQWSDDSTAMFCFEGLPIGGTVAVSTVGVRNSRQATKLWLSGFAQAVSACKPKRILFYGKPVDGFKAPEGVQIVYYENSVTARMHHDRKSKNANKERLAA